MVYTVPTGRLHLKTFFLDVVVVFTHAFILSFFNFQFSINHHSVKRNIIKTMSAALYYYMYIKNYLSSSVGADGSL